MGEWRSSFPDLPSLDAIGEQVVDAALRQEAKDAQQGARRTSGPRIRRPWPLGAWRRRGLRVGAIAGLGAAVAVLAISLWPGDGSTPAGPSAALASRLCVQSGPGPAAACLDALGDLAAADDVLAEGKVFYRRDLWSQSIMYIGPDGRPQIQPRGPGVFGIVRAGTQELWVAPDRSGRLEYGPAERPYLPSEADKRAWRAAGSPNLDRLAGGPTHRDDLRPRSFSAGELDAELLGNGELVDALPKGDPLRDLPTEPEALARELQRIGWYQRVHISGEGPCAADLHDCSAATRRNIEGRYGTNITTLLRYPFAPPELRRSLLHLLGTIPGAQRLGALRDPAGRLGAGILIPENLNDGLNVIVFDLATGRLLADGHADDGTPATLRWHDVYDLKVGAVDRIGQRPS
jgi:hypothetical protein